MRTGEAAGGTVIWAQLVLAGTGGAMLGPRASQRSKLRAKGDCRVLRAANDERVEGPLRRCQGHPVMHAEAWTAGRGSFQEAVAVRHLHRWQGRPVHHGSGGNDSVLVKKEGDQCIDVVAGEGFLGYRLCRCSTSVRSSRFAAP